MPDTTHFDDYPIKRAVRQATPGLFSFWGPSGCGKTLSALLLARGLVGPNGKIGLIDTENKRALIYAEEGGGWDHMDLQPPFTPERYSAALRTFERAGGYDCIIVDSMSHVWEGEGGVIDMAEAETSASGKQLQGLGKWKRPKMAYKRMVNDMLRAPMHVIFCLRAKDLNRQKGSDSIENVGLTPISEKNFIFEMTVSILLGPDHMPMHQPREPFKINPLIPPVKAPKEIWGTIKPNEFVGTKTGAEMAAWINAGAEVDRTTEDLKRQARDIATKGTAELQRFWTELPNDGRRRLVAIKDELKQTAIEADEEEAGETDDALFTETKPKDDPLADQFTQGKALAPATAEPAKADTSWLLAFADGLAKAASLPAINKLKADHKADLEGFKVSNPDGWQELMDKVDLRKEAIKEKDAEL